MNLKLETEFSKAEILKDVDTLKKQINGYRPFPDDLEGRVMQKLRLDWNYNSNAIEGNKLTYGETVALIMEGITASGKPLKDSLDIRGHDKAIDFLISIVKDGRPVTESEIRALHEMILVEPYEVKAKTKEGLPTSKRISLGEYKKLPNHVETSTGQLHYYATPEETPAKMQELMEWYHEASNDKDVHPVVLAALFHHKFVAIHPFDDGNGRLSRILMNLALMQKGLPPVVIKMDDRQNYYSLLSRADNNDNWPFVEYIAQGVFKSLTLYEKGASGEGIEDDDDLDKEIALFKMELSNTANVKEKKSQDLIENILITQIELLSNKLAAKTKKLEDLFLQYSYGVVVKIDNEHTRFNSINDFLTSFDQIRKGQLLKNLDSVNLAAMFTKFRNAENDFNVMTLLGITFEEYYYRFLIGPDEVFSKLYHEKLTPNEQQEIIRRFIDNIKGKITEELKSPE